MRKIWLAGVALALLAPAPGQSREMTADTSLRAIATTRPPDGEARMRRARPYHFRKVQPLLVLAPRCDFACWFFNRPDAGDYTPPPVQPAPDPPIPPQPPQPW
jgi:hypothetical protein